MTLEASVAELAHLRKKAQELAADRKERPTTVHLLSVLAAGESPASKLLRERRCDPEELVRGARSVDDEIGHDITTIMASAREMALRANAREPGAMHVLWAVLASPRCAAFRALKQAGKDVARLRTTVLELVHGVQPARREVPERKPTHDTMLPPPPSAGMSMPAVRVPMMPPLPGSSRPARATPAKTPSISPPGTLAPRKSHVRRVHTPSGEGSGSVRSGNGSFILDKAKTPTLAALGRNLTALAAERSLADVVCREPEVEQLLDILYKKQNCCPVLIGKAGVGKTSVVHALALRLATKAPGGRPMALVELAPSELLSGTAARGSLAERMATLRSEVKSTGGRVLLFVDDLHELLSGGGDEAVSELKTGLARGELRLVGAMVEEHRKLIESDPQLARLFTLVEIEEPDEEEAFFILKSVVRDLSKHHDLDYSDDGLATAISWCLRYVSGRALPDKAVGVLDLAGARLRRSIDEGSTISQRAVGREDVAHVVSQLTDVPVERLLESDRERMLGLGRFLQERIVGHETALSKIAAVLRRNAAGLRGRRPIGSFLLLGPTGVGKTETAKAIAEALFDSPDAMTRIDLSEYSEPHAVARLIGAPPGYVGHEAGGQLTDAVRRRPYQVVLLDEVEKAHQDVLESFLQVLDEGRLTDGRGKTIDFTNTVIILTSNLGSGEAKRARTVKAVGFVSSNDNVHAKAEEATLAAAKTALPPELYNRIDEVLCYRALARADVMAIAKRMLEDLGATLQAKGIALQIDDDVVDALMRSGGFDEEFGARPMRRAIGRLVEAPLAELILKGDLASGSTALLHCEGGEVHIDAVASLKDAVGA